MKEAEASRDAAEAEMKEVLKQQQQVIQASKGNAKSRKMAKKKAKRQAEKDFVEKKYQMLTDDEKICFSKWSKAQWHQFSKM